MENNVDCHFDFVTVAYIFTPYSRSTLKFDMTFGRRAKKTVETNT